MGEVLLSDPASSTLSSRKLASYFFVLRCSGNVWYRHLFCDLSAGSVGKILNMEVWPFLLSDCNVFQLLYRSRVSFIYLVSETEPASEML